MAQYKNLSALFFLLGFLLKPYDSSAQWGKDNIPNVVLIYTDDLGYGDLSFAGGKIPTPNIDKLFGEGINFTHAYSSAATCTPSRYSLLTGEYAWRSKGRGVARGNASALIDSGRQTLASVFKEAGFKTAVIGKWHLGLGGADGPDWNGVISPGPLDIGFDEAFLIPATGDRVPTVFVKNDRVLNLDPSDPITVSYGEKVGDWPTGKENPELLTTMYSHGHDQTIVNGVSRIGYMTGGKSALWRDEDISDRLVEESRKFISNSGNQPFFLYFSTHDIHVPRIAHERWQGRSGFGPRGDVILQLDEAVGMILNHLEKEKKLDSTLIIFTSDNGPVWDDGYVDLAFELIGDHDATGGLRGGKYSAFEAGTRVPFAVFGPGIPKGETQETIFSQIDLLASFASLLGQSTDVNSAPDSEDHHLVLLGKSEEGREGLVQEAISGVLSYVSNDGFKYIPPSNGAAIVPWGPKIETGFSEKPQLYTLSDKREVENLADKMPEKRAELAKKLQAVIDQK
ncbi:sulfatase-like hydrolase/transferase [Algoriphagus sediminis]|uniref:Sulfatase-like hydrolase/transferase n=1 Tax=Algoriphagus sediminis TaxID=3057113 RepID=A0ABT7Y8Y0_9BACT|nr:sulfatase-like hydrolase/transferase [Algoriphagus sediminis]MDN3202694.1 sulfatase-like hydrolase/transferase [Algoriphagus sediminis]